MKIQIESSRLKQLENAERKLSALEAGGVDNWEFYDEALTQYVEEVEQEEVINSFLEDIEVALLYGVFEPSERGAGLSSTEEARIEAYNILKNFLQTLKTKETTVGRISKA